MAAETIDNYQLIMITSSEIHSESRWTAWSDAGESTDISYECDWCGEAVSRESASRREVGTGEDAVVVLLCPDCDHGTDD
jgi:hypothetical protein